MDEKIAEKCENVEENLVEMKKIPFMFKTEDTVDPEKLKMLENNEELRMYLRNPHLRNFLKEIDQSPTPWKAMKAAMQEPLFLEFADECLKVVEPES